MVEVLKFLKFLKSGKSGIVGGIQGGLDVYLYTVYTGIFEILVLFLVGLGSGRRVLIYEKRNLGAVRGVL